MSDVDVKKLITTKQWVPWNAGDDGFIGNARIVGRVRILLAGGGLIHALLIEHDMGDHVQQRAVYLNRHTGNFETIGGVA